ncbi:2-aminoethylphosphonate--pyruvate transaminase [Candidatus Enterococcus ferrettii]|uniref:2-aminoethylphosphonate--pyruvate transaminase n=1 Tax=Candidatus Enterococcus ferrettii TaxID=2815324 RepID=A0ABV0EW43_9ENTE|nr:2-aminoethylphosphonate--pyruvate transaminase [Enterococcus sp. 665A]MBO1339973.1 2-aminoethylphosphonate--pyruvate transaminase [Enterococcus sp. 665A]
MHYKLLTPGPLTTTMTVKKAMLTDQCTWDQDYKEITQEIRRRLLSLAGVSEKEYTTILMQGSGSFGVEAVLSSMITPEDHLLICTNGAYGQRIATMCQRHGIVHTVYKVPENKIPKAEAVQKLLNDYPSISAIAMVHSETTSGILNELDEISALAKANDLLFIVDAMSSFGGIPMDISELKIDFLISSSNKCIQGVPGFSFVIGKKIELEKRKGYAKTLSLDLYDQYQVMEKDGKWRFTSPTHTVLAFLQALKELELEGGIEQRYLRYLTNNHLLQQKMSELGYETFIQNHQGPFITSFLYPKDRPFDFNNFYHHLKHNGFVIYPGKISDHDCFRIGNIGEIYPEDIHRLAEIVEKYSEVAYVS